MAVTSIWPVKSRLDHVINYARNPEKTRERSLVAQASLHAIDNVVEYDKGGKVAAAYEAVTKEVLEHESKERHRSRSDGVR